MLSSLTPLFLSFVSLISASIARSEKTSMKHYLENSYRGLRICDRNDDGEHVIRRRYVLDGRHWQPGTTLSWSFRDRFHLIKKELQYRAVKEIIERALEVWSNSSLGAILFRDVSPNDKAAPHRGQLDIQFAKFEHGDKEAFDGRGGIVAHSAYPPEGIVHFDASEHWSTDGRTGLDLRFVALHEIGHVLGLRHSRDPDAIMHPYYRMQLKNGIHLSEDDIKGIRRLYPSMKDTASESAIINESSERSFFGNKISKRHRILHPILPKL